MKFGVLSVANAEAISAALWYEDRQLGLADEFLFQLQLAYSLIRTDSRSLPRLISYSGHHEVRQCLMRRFPYAVIYVCRPNEALVVAVAHLHRRPFYWLTRL